MKISIILPVHNSAKHLEKCLESFVSQDYPTKRLIVVGSRSTDGSNEIIKKYSKKYSCVECLLEQDRGLSDALNIGIQHIGDKEIFGFLGADDILLKGTFKKVEQHLRQNPSDIGVFFDSYTQDAEGRKKFRMCPSNVMSLTALIRFGTVSGLQNVYLKSNLVKQFGFKRNAKYAMDYDLYLRLAAAGFGNRFNRIAFPSTININDNNISTTFRKESRREALTFAYGAAPNLLLKTLIRFRLLRLGFLRV